MDKAEIQKLFESNRLGEADALLCDNALAQDPWALFMRGRIAWKRGDKSAAISFYTSAAAIDQTSEAAVALAQATEVMNFFNKDLYNP